MTTTTDLAIRPFEVHVPDDDLADLQRRIAATRWPPKELVTEPGQPCVMISGRAFSWREVTWMKWMPSPSISVLKCGSAFSCASHLRQS
jgi:hypothetical protein